MKILNLEDIPSKKRSSKLKDDLVEIINSIPSGKAAETFFKVNDALKLRYHTKNNEQLKNIKIISRGGVVYVAKLKERKKPC